MSLGLIIDWEEPDMDWGDMQLLNASAAEGLKFLDRTSAQLPRWAQKALVAQARYPVVKNGSFVLVKINDLWLSSGFGR